MKLVHNNFINFFVKRLDKSLILCYNGIVEEWRLKNIAVETVFFLLKWYSYCNMKIKICWNWIFILQYEKNYIIIRCIHITI